MWQGARKKHEEKYGLLTSLPRTDVVDTFIVVVVVVVCFWSKMQNNWRMFVVRWLDISQLRLNLAKMAKSMVAVAPFFLDFEWIRCY